MSVLCCCADGNLTAAGTWELVDATSYLDSQSNSTTLTTSYVESASFTPGAITIDGIAVKISARLGTTGTMSVRLAQAGVTVTGTEVVVNVSDLPTCSALTSTTVPSAAGEGGWFFLKFAAPVLLVTATAYTLSAKTSSSTQVNLYRNSTAGNWARFLRTTTTQAPAAGDDMVITKEWTAAATGTARVVTMNSTAATDYGSALTSTIVAALAICLGGTLIYGVTAATNYTLRLSGHLIVYNGGVLNAGTTGAPMPRDSTAALEMDCAADGDFGVLLKNGSVSTFQGLSRTVGKNVTWSKLTANMAAAATSATIADDTGWLSGDEVAFSPTGQTYSEGDRVTLNAGAGSTSLAWTGGVTFGHLGTSPLQGEAMLLTRNVRFRSVSATAMTFIFVGGTATLDADWTSFRYIGVVATGKIGINFDAAAGGVASFEYCSFYDAESRCASALADAGTFTINQCTVYAVADSNREVFSSVAISVGTTNITNNCICPVAGCGALGFSAGFGGTLTGNVISGSFPTALAASGLMTTAWDSNEFHSNRGSTILNFTAGSVMTRFTCWHTSNVVAGGFRIQSASALTLDRCKAYGNSGSNYIIESGTGFGSIKFLDCEGYGTSSFATTNNVNLSSIVVAARIEMFSCLWSVAAGVLVACTNDLNFGASIVACPIYADNCKFSGTNVTTGLTTLSSIGDKTESIFLRSQRHGQLDDAHRTYFPTGNTLANAAVFVSAAPSVELQPSSASFKLKSGSFLLLVDDGATKTFDIEVRKSGTYNGNAPRLMLKRQDSIGVIVDTVCDTLSVAADIWETLTFTTGAALENGAFEFYVDCDGTAGSVYLDDIAVS